MGLFSDMFSGTATRTPRGAVPAIVHFERLCRDIGWDVDERLDDTGIVLNFKDPVFDVRPVLITASSNSDLAALVCFSFAKFPANDVPPALTYHLLGRNKEAFFHSWRAGKKDDGTVTFSTSYATFASALQPSVFKTICEHMVKDVGEVDKTLREVGLI